MLTARRVQWYVARARSMPPAEFAHRARELTARRRYRAHPPRVALPPGPARRVLAPVVRAWAAQEGLVPLWGQAAEGIAAGRLEVFGLARDFPPEGAPRWHEDPTTGRSWPTTYCFDVDYRDGGDGLGDVKHVWELNRLLYLLPVAAWAAGEQDRAAAQVCVRHVRSWWSANPPRQGVGWGSGIECAMRVVALVAVDELLEGMVDQAFHDDVRRSLAEHADWIARFPSLHSSANNHRLAELVGELLAGARYPDLLPPSRTRALLDELAEQAVAQTSPDGVSWEQATGYALFALEWLALGRLAAAASDLRDSRLDDRAAAALSALGVLSDARGTVVRIGDDDASALLVGLVPEPSRLAALHSLVTGRWAHPPRPRGITTLHEGGYTAVRDGSGDDEVLLVLDHGPLGMGHLAAHAHADVLSVWMHLGGRPLLVDAGTYLYHAAGPWRDVLRSTAVHNTLTVGGRDSSTMSGPFNWSRRERATGRLVAGRETPDGWALEAEHDGYLSTWGVRHRRTVEKAAPGHYRLTDELRGPGRHPCAATLLLAPDVEVVETGAGWTLHREGEVLGELVVAAGARRSAVRGQEQPARGWCSPTFGLLLPAWQLTVESDLGEGDRLRVELRLAGSLGASAHG